MRTIAVLFFALLAISCGKHETVPSSSNNMADVIFVNESKYGVSIYSNSFSGPLLNEEKLAPNDMFSVEVYPSNNHGVGSVFPIRYWYQMEGSDVWISGTDPDPDAQIKINIEAGEEYVVYIPNPSSDKLVGADSYLKMKNSSTMPIEITRLAATLKQANGEYPVQSGKTGVYELNSTSEGVEYDGYTVSQGMSNTTPIPKFTAIKGFIYNFEFDGTKVIQGKTEKTL